MPWLEGISSVADGSNKGWRAKTWAEMATSKKKQKTKRPGISAAILTV